MKRKIVTSAVVVLLAAGSMAAPAAADAPGGDSDNSWIIERIARGAGRNVCSLNNIKACFNSK